MYLTSPAITYRSSNPARPSLPRKGSCCLPTNAQRFKLDEGLRERYRIEDISAATLPRDYERNPRIHRCYEIRLSQAAVHA